MTSKCHWMPFYPCDYLGDTGHLSTLEHGAYLLLIMHYWMKGGLPDNEQQLARICRLPDYRWRKIRDTIAGLFHDGWKHKRIDDELAKAETLRAKKSAAGKVSSAAKRANPLKNNEASSTPVDTITVTNTKKEERRASPQGRPCARFNVADLPTFNVPTVPARDGQELETRQDALGGALAAPVAEPPISRPYTLDENTYRLAPLPPRRPEKLIAAPDKSAEDGPIQISAALLASPMLRRVANGQG